MVHHADACEILVLSLSEFEQRNDGSLLVLAGIAGNEFIGNSLVCFCEREGDRRIVVVCITMDLSSTPRISNGQDRALRADEERIRTSDTRCAQASLLNRALLSD